MELPTDLGELVPAIPDDAPFTPEQRLWLGGYLAGLRAAKAAAPAAEQSSSTPPVHVLYGTQTGNAELVAEDTTSALKAAGVDARMAGLDEITPESVVGMGRVAVICSTYGQGEMPDNAELFWEALEKSGAPRLDSVQYAVFALGDSSYEDFCHAGKLIDTRLEQLGGTRLVPRVDCDVDYDEPAQRWVHDLIREVAAGDGSPAEPVEEAAPPRRTETWGRRNPYPAALVASRRLSGPGSVKDIRHHELALGDSGLTYAAGDALAVQPCNDPALVELLLEHLGVGRDEALGARFRTDYEIASPSRELLGELGRRSRHEELRRALTSDDRVTRDDFLWGRDTLDLLRLSEVRFEVEEFLGLLKPLQHRAYSISSSPLVSPDRIHLTVASVRFGGSGREHGGICSTHLADRLAEGATAGVFVQHNTSFRPPTDDDAPVIMVGPGTGVAPFRAFLQERQERGARGRNWLFFGDQHREHDFLYSDELGAMHDDGLLTRLDLAFSRDRGGEKVYVQDRMRENGAELYAWLREGGHFYVCGDATRMARDVDTALHEVVAEHGHLDAGGAAEYVGALKREKRYLRDVY